MAPRSYQLSLQPNLGMRLHRVIHDRYVSAFSARVRNQRRACRALTRTVDGLRTIVENRVANIDSELTLRHLDARPYTHGGAAAVAISTSSHRGGS